MNQKHDDVMYKHITRTYEERTTFKTLLNVFYIFDNTILEQTLY